MEMEEEEQPAEVLFRASKRRKVVRKPAFHEGEDAALPTTEDTEIKTPDLEGEQNGVGGVARVQRKGGVRKLGIGFSSAETSRNSGREQSEELALVPITQNGMPDLPKIDRFVKPTGKVGVTDDRHMMAYVDSKLAEARPFADTPPPSAFPDLHATSSIAEHHEQSDEKDLNTIPVTQQPHPPPNDRTYQQAQERSTRIYQRPTKKPKRQPPPREENDVARDSMIDLIMGENQVPHYDRSGTQSQGDRDDVAEEEAFKERLLADLAKNKRRPPLQKSSASTSTGPKLGGSRAARERMRAMEEAKGGGSGKK